MHELSLLADLLRKIDSVVREQNALRVRRVSLWLGALSHMSKEHFREHFARAVRGTASEGADLDIEVSDDIADPRAQDIVLRSVDVEVDDDAESDPESDIESDPESDPESDAVRRRRW